MIKVDNDDDPTSYHPPRRGSGDRVPSKFTVYVSNLDFTLTNNDLLTYFSTFDKIDINEEVDETRFEDDGWVSAVAFTGVISVADGNESQKDATTSRGLKSSVEASSSGAPPADAWQQAWRAIAPQWEQIRAKTKRVPEIPILRVNQMDAARLDEEMTSMLREQLSRVFSLSQPGLLLRYEPELNAFLEFLVWRFSIWVDKPTPGNALMNLRYRNELSYKRYLNFGKVRTGLEGAGLTKMQKILYCLFVVGGRYAWARLQLISAFQRWGDRQRASWARRAWLLLQKIESFYKIVGFANLVLFFHSGRYPSIVERLLSARLVYEKSDMNRAVSFEYMNRQLVWHEFSELLLLVLPLLNMMSIRKVLMFPFSTQAPVSSLREDACPICEACPIVTPYMALPCCHLYCYYCLRTRSLSDRNFKCTRCSISVVALKRHQVEVGLGESQETLD